MKYTMGYEMIVLDTDLNSHRTQYVYKLLGFQKVQIAIDSWRHQLGNLQSSIDYELVADNFLDCS